MYNLKAKRRQKEYSPVNIGQGHLFIVKASNLDFCGEHDGQYKNIVSSN
jgi:hypothetical protein